MAKVRFVFVSADETFKLNRNEADEISKKNRNVRFDYVSNNKEPLAAVYNVILKEDNSEFDYVAFAHADVEFDFEAVAEQLDSVSGKYDLIGLCGCSKFKVSESPLNWYCGSRAFPESRWGCVMHGELGNQISFFSSHHPDVSDHEVACLDGLCLVFSKKAIESGLRFDEKLGAFSHYDTDISLQAVLNYKFKLGVLVRKELKHFSVGKSILTEKFKEDEKLFRKKWNF